MVALSATRENQKRRLLFPQPLCRAAPSTTMQWSPPSGPLPPPTHTHSPPGRKADHRVSTGGLLLQETQPSEGNTPDLAASSKHTSSQFSPGAHFKIPMDSPCFHFWRTVSLLLSSSHRMGKKPTPVSSCPVRSVPPGLCSQHPFLRQHSLGIADPAVF